MCCDVYQSQSEYAALKYNYEMNLKESPQICFGLLIGQMTKLGPNHLEF